MAFSTADKGGMAELEAPSDFSDSSSRIQEIDGISQLHRSLSGMPIETNVTRERRRKFIRGTTDREGRCIRIMIDLDWDR